MVLIGQALDTFSINRVPEFTAPTHFDEKLKLNISNITSTLVLVNKDLP